MIDKHADFVHLHVHSEYSLLDRPMVFLDVPKLIGKTMQRKDTMVDIDTWGRRAGTIARKPEAICALVAHSLAHAAEHAQIRRAMAKDLFYNPGCATDAAIAWMCETFKPVPTPTVAG